MQTTIKNKNSILELWRFIACVVIVLHHSKGLNAEVIYFQFGWIFVDFFFLVTGFFTIKHFDQKKESHTNGVAREAILYTIKKFSIFLPYVLISFVIRGLIELLFCKNTDISYYGHLILEMTLLTSQFENVNALWFLSALFIVFPVFCCFCQIKKKSIVAILSLLYVALYYNASYAFHYHVFPLHLFRALAALLLGVIAYFISIVIKQISIGRALKILLTLIEEGGLLFLLYETNANGISNWTGILIVFACTTLLLSGITYSSSVHVTLFNFLGKMSMVFFILHPPIITLLEIIKSDMKYDVLLCILFGSLLFISLVSLLLIEKLRKGKKNIADKIELLLEGEKCN